MILACVAFSLAACGKAAISEHRMIHAPPRAANCELALVEVDITSMTFNQTWDVLGYVSLLDRGTQDPNAAENRALVRPRACAMGGTTIALSQNATNETMLGTGSGVSYMVLRPKSAPAAPTAF
jgi:hypothetical protein